MTLPTYSNVEKKHQALFMLEVTRGNPNGDPDMGNRPRATSDGYGLISDVAIKSRIRGYIYAAYGTEEGNDIYCRRRDMVALNDLHEEAYESLRIVSTGSKQNPLDTRQARQWMVGKYWDNRVIGMVMTTGFNCGQVCGPVQVGVAQSVDPIEIVEMTITRQAITKHEDLEKKSTEMGQKYIIPYAVYIGHIYFSPLQAKSTGCTPEDLDRFWKALAWCWDLDRSASRGSIALRGLHIFTHDRPMGNAPAHQIFERISIERREDVAVAHKFSDYKVDVNLENLPAGVTYSCLVG